MTTKMREYVSRYQSLPDEQSKIEALFLLLGGLGETLDKSIGPSVPREAILGVLERALDLAGEAQAVARAEAREFGDCGVTGNPLPRIADGSSAIASDVENHPPRGSE